MKKFKNVMECIYRHGIEDEFRPSRTKKTTAIPGTIEKLEVLKQRAENGEELWHPDDVADWTGGRDRLLTQTNQL